MSGVGGVGGIDRVMALRAQILEKNQALARANAGASAAVPAPAAQPTSFADTMQDALGKVNAGQQRAAALSESYERGETVYHGDRRRPVEPVLLLDRDELLDRPAARAELGLDPERPAILFQLGSRNNYDYGELFEIAHAHLRRRYDVQIAVAEWLIAEKWTSPRRLAILGGSNGGLLVGAALTQRPELFRAVVCMVPLLDMVRYHKFLIARLWIPEYGSADDPEQFKWLHAYSPYHRVKKGTPYPAVLLATAESDTRVDALHARKTYL